MSQHFPIEFTTQTQQLQLLDGLDDWWQRGLLDDTEISICIALDASHPQLLAGLETWLQQGLLEEETVRVWCRRYLSCKVPIPVVSTPTPQTPVKVSPPPEIEMEKQPVAVAEKRPSWLSERLQSLQAELSLQWLLFLGVLMVVVSSGVLAASQWENFPPAGQYSVLLGYTLCFWGVSGWATKQANLPLTSQTLRMVALLLLPINFWAMDEFGLWQNPLGWGVMIVATGILTTVAFGINYQRQTSSLLIYPYLGLSYLHWGWNLVAFPIIAVYLAIFGVIGFFAWQRKRENLSFRLLLYAVAILLFRAVFVEGVAITQLGLAIGASGWLLWWLSQPFSDNLPVEKEQPSTMSLQAQAGGILLFLGWVVAVGADFPWQAIALSFLALSIFFYRLQYLWDNLDFATILLIGLQIHWLVWRLFPQDVQSQIITTAASLTHSSSYPESLCSLAFFPYLIVIVGFTDGLYRYSLRLNTSGGIAKENYPVGSATILVAANPTTEINGNDYTSTSSQKVQEVAKFGDAIALCFGIILISISLVSPFLRSLTLFNATVTCAIVTHRRGKLGIQDSLQLLVYLTHLTGLATLTTAIDYIFPSLSFTAWGIILLTLTLLEWGFSLIPLHSYSSIIWRKSEWLYGFGLAAISYVLLGSEISLWGLLWLVIPVTLTAMATLPLSSPLEWLTPPINSPEILSFLSIVGLIAIQFLTLPLPNARLISLGVASLLMLSNTSQLRHIAAAGVTIGFYLSFITTLLQEIFYPTVSEWLIIGGITLVSLWILRKQFVRKQNSLTLLYAKASDGWGITLYTIFLSLLTLHSFLLYSEFASVSINAFIAEAILIVALLYRSFPSPGNWAIYALCWNVEILIAEGIGFIDSELTYLAIANLILGLGVQIAGDIWQRKQNLHHLSSSWHIIPLVYATLGAALRWGTFTRWTGLTTLALAIIVIGVGRRREKFKPLLYFALVGVTASAYESLFYQFSLSSGGAIGDAFILMATLGTGIVYGYRILSRWLQSYLHLTRQEIAIVSHLHWVGSSALLLAATAYPIGEAMSLGFVTGVLLVQYAILSGRNHPHLITGEIWVYMGFIEAFGMRIYWLSTPVAQALNDPLIAWKGAFVALFAYFLYILPWERWGWSKRPWQIAGLIIPLIAILETPYRMNFISIGIIAAFYLVPTILSRQIRYTYLSLIVLNWLLFRWFWTLELSDPLWYAIPIGLSFLYIAQVDSALKSPPNKQSRHIIRSFGLGIICFGAFFHHLDTGIVPGIISFVAILLGLSLRIRSFLYVGTITFLITVFYQLGFLIFDYPFSKWIIGLILGIFFIWIAATFETRREQITTFVSNWLAELQEWE